MFSKFLRLVQLSYPYLVIKFIESLGNPKHYCSIVSPLQKYLKVSFSLKVTFPIFNSKFVYKYNLVELHPISEQKLKLPFLSDEKCFGRRLDPSSVNNTDFGRYKYALVFSESERERFCYKFSSILIRAQNVQTYTNFI